MNSGVLAAFISLAAVTLGFLIGSVTIIAMFPENGGLFSLVMFVTSCICATNTFKYIRVYLNISDRDLI